MGCLRMQSLYLQNANGPAAESMLSFSDSVMLLVLPIAFGVLLFIVSLLLKVCTHRHLTEHQSLEFTWTLLPALSLLFLAGPSLSLLYLLDEVGFPLSTTKVQGHQWYWVYESYDVRLFHSEAYITAGASRLLNTDVSLCVNRNIVLRFLVTAADVLHS